MTFRLLGLSALAGCLFLVAACSPATGGQAARGPAVKAPAKAASTTTFAGFFGASLELQDFGSFGQADTSIIPSGDPRFPSALRVRYPADSASQLAAATADTPHGGAQYYLADVNGPVDDAYLRYYLRFESGFDFVKGGKLPGLYGGRVTSGRKIPDGTNGFSTRYMWRANGAAEVYAYLPTSVAHGTSLGRGSWVWPTDVWTEVQQHVRLNTPGRSDGVVQVWLNGVLVLNESGLTFRSDASLQIDGLFFSTFFGGGDASWSTPRDQYADFADFTVSTRPIND
jgi:hypothetical protein